MGTEVPVRGSLGADFLHEAFDEVGAKASTRGSLFPYGAG